MKVPLYLPFLLVLLTFFFSPEMAWAQDNPGDQDVSFQAFYDQLGDQGTWIQTDAYGYVFQPNVSDPNWAPYTDGQWVSTDQGWTWVSNEPWGWATYHYGRWANIDGTGWVWVPGYRWAPAWVSWRYGGGYCGWAPLPPETLEGADDGDQGYHFGNDVDVSFNIGAGCYNFLPVGDMGDSNYRGRFADRGRNYGIINNTTNVTNINVNTGQGNTGGNFRGVTTGGPSLKTVNAHSRQHVQTVQLTAAGQAGNSSLQGHALAMYAPRVSHATGQEARPARVAQTLSQPTFNRGNSITDPLDVTASVKAPAPTPQAIENARQAQEKAPIKAKIAANTTPMNPALSRPSPSLAPEVPQTPERTPTPSEDRPANSSSANQEANEPKVEHQPMEAPPAGEPSRPETTPQPSEVHPPQEVRPQQEEQPTEHHSQQQLRPQEQEQPLEHQQPQQEIRPQQQEQPPQHQSQPPQPQPHPQAQAEQHGPQQQPAKSSSSNSGH